MSSCCLFDNDRYPEIVESKNFEFYSVCKRGDIFAHGADIAYHKGRFFATFAVNECFENTLGEKTLCYVSKNAELWEYFGEIGEVTEGLGRSHGILFEEDGKLYAYNACFTASAKPNVPNTAGCYFGGLRTEGFVLDDETDEWRSLGIISDNFWPLNHPVYIGEGKYLIPGVNCGFFSAYLVGSAEQGWERFDTPTENKWYTESACIADGNTVRLFMRNSRQEIDPDHRYLAIAISHDRGQSWEVREIALFNNNSKPSAISLSNGINCLVGNHLEGQLTTRGSLDLVSFDTKTGDFKLRLIRNKKIPNALAELYAPQDIQHAISYPSCLEHNGKLYIIYSASGPEWEGNRNRIELAVIDIDKI